MVNAGGSGINFAVCFLIYKMHNSRKKHDKMVVTVQTIVKIDEISKNIFVDKLRQDAKSG